MASKDQLYADLTISENLRVAINTVSETEWQKFFESYRQSKLRLMESTDDKDLTKLKAQITQITEFENCFKALKQSFSLQAAQQQNQRR